MMQACSCCRQHQHKAWHQRPVCVANRWQTVARAHRSDPV